MAMYGGIQMKNKRGTCAVAPSLCSSLSLALALACQYPAVAHSQVYARTVYSYASHPDLPLKLYVQGRLGIVSPSYARSYQIVAYRYLSGKPLTQGEQAEYLALWHTRLHLPLCRHEPHALNSWLKVRAKLISVKEKDPPYEDVERCSEAINDFCYLNCQDEAFKTASTALAQRIAKYGAGSSYVKEWLKGQDGVFCHCAAPRFDYRANKLPPEPAFPPKLPDSVPLELRQDRDYQIAAAHFYAQQLDQALTLFGAIANDKSSVWQVTARYMMVRTLVRQGSLSIKDEYARAPLLKAVALSRELIADARFAPFKSSLKNLIDYAELHLDPLGTVGRLGKILAEPASSADLRVKVDDYTILLDRDFPDFTYGAGEPLKFTADPEFAAMMKKDDLTDWIWSFTAADASTNKNHLAHEIERFKSHHNLAWAVALASDLKGNEPVCKDVLAALARVPKSDPAFLTASHYRAKLLQSAGRIKECLAVVSDALASKALTPSAFNDLSDIKLELASSFDQFMSLSFRPPAVVIVAGDYSELPEDMDTLEQSNTFPHYPVVLTPESAVAFNEHLPLRYFAAACASKVLPARCRLDFAQATFVRAVMLGDYATAGKVTALLKRSYPAMAKRVAAFDSAATDSDRQFAAAFLILQYPGMRPTVTGGSGREIPFNYIDEWRDNWWDKETFGRSEYSADQMPAEALLNISFASAADKARAKSELNKLKAQGLAHNYLGKIVIAYARAHPSDPRVPEALAMTVKATRFTDTYSGVAADVSRKAFQLLHLKYPGSPWTKQTPYHY
jgi:hypothetical protein